MPDDVVERGSKAGKVGRRMALAVTTFAAAATGMQSTSNGILGANTREASREELPKRVRGMAPGWVQCSLVYYNPSFVAYLEGLFHFESEWRNCVGPGIGWDNGYIKVYARKEVGFDVWADQYSRLNYFNAGT